ncbi:hypothetical protein [Aliagarivorans taiwanensis]|uniref:hypothetical protein n=1 Tax=Aliagarivorans taiwanensis TaxID=561966 RepID=UPI00040B4B3B|nr:hypothetical protein [Aliagarivorans taiwanensis]
MTASALSKHERYRLAIGRFTFAALAYGYLANGKQPMTPLLVRFIKSKMDLPHYRPIRADLKLLLREAKRADLLNLIWNLRRSYDPTLLKTPLDQFRFALSLVPELNVHVGLECEVSKLQGDKLWVGASCIQASFNQDEELVTPLSLTAQCGAGKLEGIRQLMIGKGGFDVSITSLTQDTHIVQLQRSRMARQQVA